MSEFRFDSFVSYPFCDELCDNALIHEQAAADLARDLSRERFRQFFEEAVYLTIGEGSVFRFAKGRQEK
jgi:hypothetical protein